MNEDDVTVVSDYSDYKLWAAYYDNEGYEGRVLEDLEEEEEEEEEKEEEGEEEEEEEEEEKEKEPTDVDIFAGLLTQFRDKRAERIAAEAEAKKEKLRQLIGIEKKKDVSEETLITPEEKSVVSTVSSTESSIHPCLKDIDISDSQLKLQNLYTTYPIPDDPGLVPAFWTIHERRPSYEDDGVMKFYDLTKETGIKPIRALEDMLMSDTINLQYYGLNPRVIRPICEALMENPWVQTILLTENWLSEDACYHLNNLLLRNSTVSTLVLSGCQIGPKGAAKLHDGISNSATLNTLDLSDCNIQNDGLERVTAAVCNNNSLEDLSLRDNHLHESCTDTLLNLVSCSKTLRRLNLSWNSLYSAKLWRRLVRAFESNVVLVDLDFSWNALGKECVRFLRLLLLRSQTLKRLTLNGNRFYDEEAAIIARGLAGNHVLEELYLADNPLKGAGVFVLVRAVTPERSPESQLRVLDLTNIWANKDVLVLLEVIENHRPWLNVRLGGILSNYKVKGPDVKTILLKRARYEALRPKKRRRRRNFGHFILTLSDDYISRTKFTQLVRSFRLKLSKSLLSEIITAFAGPNKTIDQGLMKSVYMKIYPDTKPPPERQSKKKKKTKTK